MARRPTADELWEKAEAVVEEYADRDALLDDVERYYFLDFGDENTENDEGIEVLHYPHGTNAVDLVCDLLAGADVNLTVPALSDKERDKGLADDTERFLNYLLRESERAQHQRLMMRAVWLAAVRGCVCGRVVVLYDRMRKDTEQWSLDSDRMPLLLQVRDPRHVYPRFGPDDLSYVVEQWDRTVQSVRDSYGDELLPGQDASRSVTWTEYWDPKWHCYWADGVVIEKGSRFRRAGPWPHRMGGIPYAWEFCRETAKEEPNERVRPMLAGVRALIDRLDMSASQMATALSRYHGDALIAHTDREEPELDLRPGAINYLGLEESIDWLRASKAPVDMPQERADLMAQFERATFPTSLYGKEPGSVLAGYAISMLNQSGMVRLKPITEALQLWLSSMLERCLMVAENVLQPLLGGPVPYWTMDTVEDRRRRTVRAEGSLDAARLAGRYAVNVTLGDVLPSDEQAHVVMAQKAREPGPDGRPLLSWETAAEKFKLASSPAEERERIDREIARADEEVVKLRIALYAEEEKAELKKKLEKLGVSPDEVLGRGQQPPAPAPVQMPMPQAGMGMGVPPQVMPPQMAGMTPELAGQVPGMQMPDLSQLTPAEYQQFMQLYGGGV